MLSQGAKLLLADLGKDPDVFAPTKGRKKVAGELEVRGLASLRASGAAARITKAGIYALRQAEANR